MDEEEIRRLAEQVRKLYELAEPALKAYQANKDLIESLSRHASEIQRQVSEFVDMRDVEKVWQAAAVLRGEGTLTTSATVYPAIVQATTTIPQPKVLAETGGAVDIFEVTKSPTPAELEKSVRKAVTEGLHSLTSREMFWTIVVPVGGANLGLLHLLPPAGSGPIGQAFGGALTSITLYLFFTRNKPPGS